MNWKPFSCQPPAFTHQLHNFSKEPYHAHLPRPPPSPASLSHLQHLSPLSTTGDGRELGEAVFPCYTWTEQLWEPKQNESPHAWSEIQSPASACFLPLQAHFSPEWAPIPLAFLLGAPGFRPPVAPAWNILAPKSHWAPFLPSLSCCPNSTSFHCVPASACQPGHSPSCCLALLSLVVLITN